MSFGLGLGLHLLSDVGRDELELFLHAVQLGLKEPDALLLGGGRRTTGRALNPRRGDGPLGGGRSVGRPTESRCRGRGPYLRRMRLSRARVTGGLGPGEVTLGGVTSATFLLIALARPELFPEVGTVLLDGVARADVPAMRTGRRSLHGHGGRVIKLIRVFGRLRWVVVHFFYS